MLLAAHLLLCHAALDNATTTQLTSLNLNVTTTAANGQLPVAFATQRLLVAPYLDSSFADQYLQGSS